MKKRNFRDLLEGQWADGKFLCVGLDPEVKKLPEPLKMRFTEYSATTPRNSFFFFCDDIIEATKDIAAAYKLNLAFFEEIGTKGALALDNIVRCAHQNAPHIPVILDGKRGDIGNSNELYARALAHADAVTVNPYLGGESLAPFLDDPDKGVFVLCRTSNPGAGEFQDYAQGGVPLYQHVAHRFAHHWNKNGNCGLVVGATCPEELAEVRAIVGDGFPLLIPGIGAQGGDLEQTVRAGKDKKNQGFLVNASRSIIYASSGNNYAYAAAGEALKLHNAIKQCLTEGVPA